MNWYLAKLVFRIHCGDGAHRSQFDEQLRLIEADSPDSALEKVKAMAERETKPLGEGIGNMVRWQFVNIAELYRLGMYLDGAELFSRIQEPENSEQFEKTIHRKAEMIRFNITHGLLEIV